MGFSVFPIEKNYRSNLLRGLLIVTVLATLPGCPGRKAPELMPAPPVVEAPDPPKEAPPPRQSCKEHEEEISRLRLNLLERESQIKVFQDQAASRKRLLDEAIREVVRAKAKQRSLETRAEAASEMAEAEIALKNLQGQSPAQVGTELARADDLVKMSAQEFDRENFGGSLYLSSQAKSQINAAKAEIRKAATSGGGEGETLFAAPMELITLKPSNVRSDPALGSNVLKTIASGSVITGYAFKGEWVRVRSEDGTGGWIHGTLVDKGDD
jgi:hypothetical protein